MGRNPTASVITLFFLLTSSGARDLRFTGSLSKQTSFAPGSTRTSRLAQSLGTHISALSGSSSRVPCTPGNLASRSYIASQLAHYGVEPAGDVFKESFFSFVQNSVEPELCPGGIANVVGVVRGTDPKLADEIVMYSATYDGRRASGPGQDQYDDAAASAVGLLLASRVAFRPRKRTVVFFFGGGDAGWANVGALQKFSCESIDELPEWVRNSARGCDVDGGNYPIGAVSWLDNPFLSGFSPAAIRLAVVASGLGMPVADSALDPVLAVGAESTPGLQELLGDVWQLQAPDLLFMPSKPVTDVRSGGSNNSFCSSLGFSGCLRSFNIPAVSLIQPGSQVVSRLTRGKTPIPAVDVDRLSQIYSAVLSLFNSLGADPGVSDLFSSPNRDGEKHRYTLQDARDIASGFQQLSILSLSIHDNSTCEIATSFNIELTVGVLQPMQGSPATAIPENQELLQLAATNLAALWIGIS